MGNLRYIVTSYKSPDLDGVACMYAYSEFINKVGAKANYCVFGEVQNEAKIVCEKFRIELKGVEKIEGNDKVIIVDTNDPKIISNEIRYENVTEIVDHHIPCEEMKKFTDANIQIEYVGAAATLIAERYRNQKIAISRESAILLYYGIISNTVNLKAKVTTQRDIEMTKWLQEKCEEINIDK